MNYQKILFKFIMLLPIIGLSLGPVLADYRRLGDIEADGAVGGSQRIALVIGNGGYPKKMSNNLFGPLDNPLNDADDMAKMLEHYDFEVSLVKDGNGQKMEDAIDDFTEQLQNGSVGLFYFAGHAVQVEGINYLIPVGRKFRRAKNVKHHAINATEVLELMEAAGTQVNLMILDACREHLPVKKGRGLSRLGLAEMTANGTIIAYATAPGKTASDGNGRNGVYTEQLLDALKNGGGLSIEEVFKNTGAAVKTATNDKQNPWVNSSFYGKFCFGQCRSGISLTPSPRPDVSKLLQACEIHFKANRLTTGRGGTALVCYEQVLKTDPVNTEALDGLGRIEDKYVEWIKQALQKGQKNQAQQYLASLGKVNPESPKLAELEARLKSDVSHLLRECETHFRAKRYTFGQGGTAFDCYQAVLKKAAGNAEALAGLANIERYYVEQIEGFLDNGQSNNAQNYLARLRKVNSESPKVAEFEERLSRHVAGKVFRDRLRDGTECPEMVWIQAGSFQMGDIQGGGDSDEKPVHWVSVDRFAMGKYEVTVGEFRRFVNATGYKTDAEKRDGCYVYEEEEGSWGKKKDANWRNPYFSQTHNHPVVCVSWNDATAYAKWLSRETGQTYRLSTEAEWEYAARAGTTTSRYWGKDPDEACRYANVHDKTSKQENGFSRTNHNCTDGYAQTALVGSFKPNTFDLFDMLGNVWEWTCSEFKSKHSGKESMCISQKSGSLRVLRGGAWDDIPKGVRTAYRGRYSPDGRSVNTGFRLARR